MVRRLARLLSDQMRWADCFELLLSSSRRVAPLRDRVVFLEEAAVLAEMRMRDLERAAAAYEALLEIAPEHPAAWSSLGRNYAARERWADYLRLADREVAQLSSDKASRISVLCRVAEVCRRAVGDLTLAERYWLRALDEDVLAEEALRGLGQLLQSQGRWEDLATLTERVLRASTVTTQRLRCLRQLGAGPTFVEVKEDNQASIRGVLGAGFSDMGVVDASIFLGTFVLRGKRVYVIDRSVTR